MKNNRFLFLGVVCSLFWVSQAWGHEAHEHGAAKIDLAIEGQEVEIELETPLANVISFEHAPRTPSQEKEIRAMAAIMHTNKTLFSFPDKAGCVLEKVSLKSDVISRDLLAPPSSSGGKATQSASVSPKKTKDKKDDDDEHADLDAEFAYRCQNPQALTYIRTGLFKSFPRLKRVDMQIAGPKGQRAARLTPRSNVIKW
ncbi:MAG: DUF2796 domain-containing protein [Burkholderiaceae bacterium]|jgi:hypothetical protein|nr:DUF2796 domain-containing protein [Burkholderiaceae bacterium]